MRRALLVALAAAGLAIPSLVALAAKETPAPRRERRFDHAAHAGRLASGGKPAEACAGRCHRASASGAWAQTGKLEHGRCFESCHAFETSCDTLASGGGRVCVTCHVNLKERCVPRGTPRLAGRAPELPSRYSHRTHIAPSLSGIQQCVGCHGAIGGAPRTAAAAPGHDQCGVCHGPRAGGKPPREPAMERCDGCHGGRSASAGAHALAANSYAVTGAFDHGRHAAAVGGAGAAGADCLGCHANLAQAKSDRDTPLPTMQGCYQTCHDGKRAFSATGATCTRCHRGGRR